MLFGLIYGGRLAGKAHGGGNTTKEKQYVLFYIYFKF